MSKTIPEQLQQFKSTAVKARNIINIIQSRLTWTWCKRTEPLSAGKCQLYCNTVMCHCIMERERKKRKKKRKEKSNKKPHQACDQCNFNSDKMNVANEMVSDRRRDEASMKNQIENDMKVLINQWHTLVPFCFCEPKKQRTPSSHALNVALSRNSPALSD